MTLATLGLAVDSSQAAKASGDLNQLTVAAKGAQKAADDLAAATKPAAQAAAELSKAAKPAAEAVAGLNKEASAGTSAATENAAATTRAANAHGGLSTQAMAASHSIRSTVEMLAMGIPPTQALASQMNHLSYAASGPGGITGAFSEAIGVFGRFITPLTVMGGAVVGLGTGVAYAASSWNEGEKDITRSLLGIGKASSATVDDIHHFAAASALATNESFATARSVTTELVSSSGVMRDHIGALTSDTLQFAKAMNIGSDEAAKFIATAMADPVKGAEEINNKVQFLDNSTRHYIKTLVDAGDVEKARSVIIDKMTPALTKAGQATEGWAVSWHGLKTMFSDVGSMVGSSLSGGTNQEQLAALKDRRAQMLTAGSNFVTNDEFYRDAVASINKQIDKLEAKVNEANKNPIDLHLDTEAARADALVRTLNPAIGKVESLKGAIAELEKVRDNPAAFAKMNLGDNFDTALSTAKLLARQTEEQSAATDHMNAKTLEIAENYKGYSIQVAKTLDAQKGQLAIAQAVTVQERLAAEEAAHRHSLEVDQGIKPDQGGGAIAAGARAAAEAQIRAQIEGQLLGMRDQLAVAQAVTGQQQLTAQADATRNQILRDIGDATLANAAADMQREISEARINSQIESQVTGLEQQTRMINAVAQGAGASAAAAIAYENAIRAGASATQAAALSAATLAVNTAKASAAAYEASQRMHYAAGGPQEFGNQFGNQEVGLPGTSGTDLQQAIWKANYGAGGFNTFINGGFGINGGRFDVNAIPNDQGLQFMYSQTLKAAAEKGMDSVTRAKFEAGSYQLPQAQAQAISDAFLARNNLSSDVNAQKAAAAFVGSADSSSGSGSNNSLINPMYTSGSSSVIGFRAANGIDFTVPGTGPTDSVRVDGRVTPGERLIVVPPGGSAPGDQMPSISALLSKVAARANINQRIVIQAATMRGASDTMSQLAARAARAAAAASRHR